MGHLDASWLRLRQRCYRATLDNALVEDISDVVGNGVVRMNHFNQIKMTFEATLADPSRVAPYRDCLAPFLDLDYWDEESRTIKTFSRQLGLYVCELFPTAYGAASREARLLGRDVTWLLAKSSFPNGYRIEKGQIYVQAVEAILRDAGFPRVNLRRSTKKAGRNKAWRPTVPKLKVINDLLRAIGYYSLWADNLGAPSSIPYRTLDTATPVRVYRGADGHIVDVFEVTPDPESVANQVIVTRTDPARSPLIAVATNTDPTSPTATITLGTPERPLTLARWITDANLEDQAAADALAHETLLNAGSVWTQAVLRTKPDPDWNLHDVIELDLVNNRGERVADGKWWRYGVDIGFTPAAGPTVHYLRKLLPFAEVA